jgi:hypothetical protein
MAKQKFDGQPNYWYQIALQEVAATNSYLVALANATVGLNPPVINPVFPTTPTAPPLMTANPPVLQDVIWELPAIPGPFTGTLALGDYLPAPFDQTPPVLSYGTPPADFAEALPDAPGINLAFDTPTLSVTLPAPPSLLSLNTYQFGGINMPTIDTNLPTLNVAAPSVVQYVPGSMYTSALLGSAQSVLQDYIVNGGTGLPPDVEEALWNRARDREYRAQADAIGDLERMEALGYAFPPGVYVNARLKITTEMGYVASTLSREIAIEQAKLEQSNIQWAMQSAVQLEGQLINYNNAVEQRLFDAVKYATEAGIQIYNAQVQAYAAYLDAYKTKVAIYDAMIKGELAKVEAYKAEMDAESTKAQINNALVSQYKTQVDAALANVEIFKAEIGAIQLKAEIEKMKIEIFGEQVKAYGSKVSAYTAGVEGFRAKVGAEASKQEAFKSQVQAYSAQVEAGTKTITAKIDEFKARIDAKNSEWEGYKAAAAAQSSKAQAISSINTSLSDSYRAQTSAITSYNEVLTKQWQVSIDQAQRVVEIGISAAKANAELYTTTRSLALEAAKVGAQVSAQIGAAALNSANWSWSESESISDSTSTSTSSSTSRSTSSSNNVNYNYNV